MDEHSFDKFIKDKLQDFHDDGDRASFVSLNDRLASRITIARWKTAFFVSTATMTILMIFTITHFLNHTDVQSEINNVLQTQDNHTEYQAQSRTEVDSLLYVINELKAQVRTLEEGQRSDHGDQMPTSAKENKEGSLFAQNSITSSAQQSDSFVPRMRTSEHDRLSGLHVPVAYPSPRFIIVSSSPSLRKSTMQRKSISAKMKNDLEKHYFSGIGINVAPQLSVGGLSYQSCRTTLMPGAGVGVDWILSPRLDVETSIGYSIASHPLPGGDSRYQSFQDKYYGQPVKATQVDHLLSGTVLLGYRQWLTDRDQISFKAGVGKYVAVAGKYNVTYSKGNYPDPDDHEGITQVHKIEGLRSFANMLNLNAGISRELSKSQKIELSLYYNRGLGAFNNIQTVGLQSSLWFKVR